MRPFRRGFTLLELMVAITIMAILYASLPDLFQQLRGTQVRRAVSDGQQIAIGLWGPTPDYGGFVDNIGLPTGNDPSSIATEGVGNDLVYPPSASTFATRQNVLGVVAGWNGPYVGFDPNALQADPWGTPWKITSTGLVQSAGPDQQFGTADDLSSPVAAPMLQGTSGNVTISVRDVHGALLDSNLVDVYVWSPNPNTTPRGQLVRTQLLPTAWDSTALVFKALSVSPGRHVIEAYGKNDQTLRCDRFVTGSCIGLYGHTIASVVGGTTTPVEVRLSANVPHP